MSVKSTLLNPGEIERAQEMVRRESKNIMNGLFAVNMIWFAQFFCDLLLQVGLTPVEETDKELLSIADKEKLQVRRVSTKSVVSFHPLIQKRTAETAQTLLQQKCVDQQE